MQPESPSEASSPSNMLSPDVLYRELCSSHDRIADFRAKLLALLPIASGAGLFLLLDGETADKSHLGPIGLFGFAVTLGLFLYELRGMSECLLLRWRGANVEEATGVPCHQGRFWNNPSGFIGPQGAAWVIYPAVLVAWLYVAKQQWDWIPEQALPLVYVVVAAGGYTVWRWVMNSCRQQYCDPHGAPDASR
jgi:hypothetical protein